MNTIERFQFVLLVLSLFESTNEDIRTVVLYGVPGLPSLTLPVSSTYMQMYGRLLFGQHQVLMNFILLLMAG